MDRHAIMRFAVAAVFVVAGLLFIFQGEWISGIIFLAAGPLYGWKALKGMRK